LRMAGDLHQSPTWLVWRAVTRETSFLDISGIASIPSSGIQYLLEDRRVPYISLAQKDRLMTCYCRDRIDVPRSRYAEVTALG
jgi:hypothetical protein